MCRGVWLWAGGEMAAWRHSPDSGTLSTGTLRTSKKIFDGRERDGLDGTDTLAVPLSVQTLSFTEK